MRKKKAPAKKPKGYAKLSQKEKFIAVASEFEVDEMGKDISRGVKKIAHTSVKAGLALVSVGAR
jgi:hypothetical protein